MQGAHFIVYSTERISINQLQYIVHTNIVEYFKVNNFQVLSKTIAFQMFKGHKLAWSYIHFIHPFTGITMCSKMFIEKWAFWKCSLDVS